jgi:DNA-binding NarL/FixJ family response regulator
MSGRLLVAPGHRVEAQCVGAVLAAAGLAATTQPGAGDIVGVVAVVPHDLPITATLDAIMDQKGQHPVLLLTSHFNDDAALLSAMALQFDVAAVVSLDCSLDVLATAARRLLEGRRPTRHGGTTGDGGPTTLTAREHQVFALLATGRRNHEIADVLGISSHTVRTHVQHLLTKLDVHHRQAAAAARTGLLTEKNPRRPASRRQGMSR